MTIDNTEYDVVIKGDGAASQSLDALRSMPVTTAFGGSSAVTTPSSLSEEKVLTLPSLPKSITRLSKTASPRQSCPPGKVSAVTR